MSAIASIHLTTKTLLKATEELATKDPDLAAVVRCYGPPPLWARRPGYTTLAKIILEQQVSQASANAIYQRLHKAIGGVTSLRVRKAGVSGLRRAGLTRQKAAYCVGISKAIESGELDLRQLGRLDSDAARTALIRIHGIGPWTADVYLLMALRQPDVWPHGDLALAKAATQVKKLKKLPSYDRLTKLAEQWAPWRAVAARILWHHYLSSKQLNRG